MESDLISRILNEDVAGMVAVKLPYLRQLEFDKILGYSCQSNTQSEPNCDNTKCKFFPNIKDTVETTKPPVEDAAQQQQQSFTGRCAKLLLPWRCSTPPVIEPAKCEQKCQPKPLSQCQHKQPSVEFLPKPCQPPVQPPKSQYPQPHQHIQRPPQPGPSAQHMPAKAKILYLNNRSISEEYMPPLPPPPTTTTTRTAIPILQPEPHVIKLCRQTKACRDPIDQMQYDTFVRDICHNQLIQAALDGCVNFNEIVFEKVYGENPQSTYPSSKLMSLLEAFMLRTDYERTLFTSDNRSYGSKCSEMDEVIDSLLRAEQLCGVGSKSKLTFEADVLTANIQMPKNCQNFVIHTAKTYPLF